MNPVSRVDPLIEAVRRYAAVESPSGDRAALEGMAALLESDAREAGLHVDREQGSSGDHLVWTLPARGGIPGRLLCLSHYDTVWPLGTLAHMPIIVDGDRLSGPGVYDTKSGIAVLLHALRELGAGETAHPEVRVVVVADEEVGSPTATALVQREAAAADVVLGFEPPHPNGDLKTGRRGSTRLRVSVTGVESHAGLDPDAGVNAIDELIDQVAVARKAAEGYPVLLNLGTISGGGRTNVVAGAASADFGLRFLSTEDETAVLGSFRALLPVRPGARVSTHTLSYRPTWSENDASRELRDACARIARTLGQELGGAPAGGAADTNTAGSMGKPTVDGLAPQGGGAHAAHEWVSIASIRDRAALLVALIAGILPALKDESTSKDGSHE